MGSDPPSATPQAKFLLQRCGCEPGLRNVLVSKAAWGRAQGAWEQTLRSPQLPGPYYPQPTPLLTAGRNAGLGASLSSGVLGGPSALPQPPCPSWPLASV